MKDTLKLRLLRPCLPERPELGSSGVADDLDWLNSRISKWPDLAVLNRLFIKDAAHSFDLALCPEKVDFSDSPPNHKLKT